MQQIFSQSQIFVEATYEGDLLAASAISWTHGRESSAKYSESLAGVRAETLYRQIEVDVDPYIIPQDPSSGLLYGISPEPFGTAGDGDLHLQSYSYRIPLTDDPENLVPLTEPEGYDPTCFELHRRFARAGGEFYTPRKRLPGGKTDLIGSEGALATDLLGMNDEWPVAGYQGRQSILENTQRFTQGFLWFLATDEAVPVSCQAPCWLPTLTTLGTHPQGMVSIWLLPRRVPRQRPLSSRALRPRRTAHDFGLHSHASDSITRRRPGGLGSGRRGVLAY